MGTEVDVFISNYTLVDPEIYQLWIEGHTVHEASTILNQGELGRQAGVTSDLIASDVLDHYRTYSLLEKPLSNPSKLHEQLAFQIDPQTHHLLIEKYYDLDDKVTRELLGKKLSSKHRKDLDEVAEKTGVPLKSCRRQFDNVKRIFKAVEEMPGSVIQNIENSFFLSENLARKYACVVFLACLRFETSKRKLQHLSFEAWKKCSESLMEHWTYKQIGPEFFDTEMDKEFLLELRELKVLLDKEREHKHLVLLSLKPSILTKTYLEIDSNFRVYSRPILTLATTIHRPRDLRNLFTELSQIVDIFKQAVWNLHEVDKFLAAYAQGAIDIDILRDPTLKSAWEKYMKVISECIVTMF